MTHPINSFQSAPRSRSQRHPQRQLLAVFACLALIGSGCTTMPCSRTDYLVFPEELLTYPSEPVPLRPAKRLETIKPTQKAAPKTDNGNAN